MKLLKLFGLALVNARHDAWVHVTKNGLLRSAEAIELYYTDLATAGATHILLSHMTSGPQAREAKDSSPVDAWIHSLTEFNKASIAGKLHMLGAELYLVAKGGGEKGNAFLAYDPAQWSKSVCKGAAQNYFDGVVLDLVGDFSPIQTSQFIEWLIDATQHCRHYIGRVSHVAMPSYFSATWNSVFDELIEHADHLLIQYYDQGPNCHINYYTTWVGDRCWPAWLDLSRLHSSAAHKFVVGKYIYGGISDSDRIDPSQIASWIRQAGRELGYNNGIMLWRAPTPEEAIYRQFIDNELPLMSARDDDEKQSQSAQKQLSGTEKLTEMSFTNDLPSPRRSETTVVREFHKQSIEKCQSLLHSTEPIWIEDCRVKCIYYAMHMPSKCMTGIDPGITLTKCVKSFHSYCI